VTKRRQIVGLVVSLVLVFAAAGVASHFTTRSVAEWYPTLAKPSWTPPGAVFAPVWTALYFLMAVAAWLVWRKAGGLAAARLPLALFAVQLALNAAWSILFFGLRMPGLAFGELMLLWLVIVATLAAFRRVLPAAGLLLAPYLAWVTFAGALNFALWRLNA
jgi:tryptophan-rich sensory protein